MNKTEKALVAALATTVVLGLVVRHQSQKLENYQTQYKRLRTWAGIAQRVMKETYENNPEIDLKVSKKLLNDIDFYTIMDQEHLI